MSELPPLDVQHTIALVGLLGRTGVGEVEFGYLDDEEPYRWWVKGNWKGHRVIAEEHAGADFALLDVARQVVHGGKCKKCNRRVTFPHLKEGRCGRVLVYKSDEGLTYQPLCRVLSWK